MNELIKITTNDKGDQLISGRELHEKLKSKEQYTDWISRMIDKCRLIENVHFTAISEKSENVQNRGFGNAIGIKPKIDQILTLDAAKHICMIQNSDLGFIFRDYFIECEKKLKEIAPRTYIEALKAIIAVEEEKEKLALERDYARQTKAEINNKKTATAMNTASQLSKENQKLKEEIGANRKYATIKRMEILLDMKFRWKALKKYSIKNELAIKKISDVNYGYVNAYHADAWFACYDMDLEELFG